MALTGYLNLIKKSNKSILLHDTYNLIEVEPILRASSAGYSKSDPSNAYEDASVDTDRSCLK